MSEPSVENRRPLKSRGSGWAKALAKGLARAGVSPDMISAASMGFAALGAWAFTQAATEDPVARAVALIGAGLCVQLRLLCNLFDGMVAVEHGRGSAAGPIWNELPDRIADALFLVGAGYYVQHSGVPIGWTLGWTATALALLTAYVRELGRGLGFPADFSGPMAKPHRMATLTLACLVGAIAAVWGPWRGNAVAIGLILIIVGAALTVLRRTLTLAGRLAQAKREAQPKG
jgi:phosphatidylglycerophosphate synthase